MKPINGHGDAVKRGVLSGEEALRYAMSLPGVTTTITGIDMQEALDQAIKVGERVPAVAAQKMHELRERVKPYAGDGRYELYKVSLKFDNPEARMAHDFPLDMQSVEVKEMMKATENTGRPFPEAKYERERIRLRSPNVFERRSAGGGGSLVPGEREGDGAEMRMRRRRRAGGAIPTRQLGRRASKFRRSGWAGITWARRRNRKMRWNWWHARSMRGSRSSIMRGTITTDRARITWARR